MDEETLWEIIAGNENDFTLEKIGCGWCGYFGPLKKAAIYPTRKEALIQAIIGLKGEFK